MPARILLINGSLGVGKTATAEAAGHLLASAGVPHATIDFDWLTAYYPRDADDRWGTRGGMLNLAALWRNYSARGIERLVIARVVEEESDLDEYRIAIPDCSITVARLRAQPSTLLARIRQRGPGQEWHLNRTVELALQMDEHPVGDFTVETDGRSARGVAAEVLRRAGWVQTEIADS
jgi:hypothetical protein